LREEVLSLYVLVEIRLKMAKGNLKFPALPEVVIYNEWISKWAKLDGYDLLLELGKGPSSASEWIQL